MLRWISSNNKNLELGVGNWEMGINIPNSQFPTPISLLLKPQYHTIDAITESGWGRTIFENVTKMGLAATALHFGSFHAMAIVWQIDNALLGNRLKKTGPSAAAVKFGIALEQ